MRRIHAALHAILPSALVFWIRTLKGGRVMRRQTTSYGWFGDYASWAEASADTTGYETREILQKALEAELTVRRGEAAFERDTVAFAQSDHWWPTVAALMYCAATSGGSLRVVDFGGALGNTWSQYRQFWPALREVCWGIVELPAYVETGRNHLHDVGLSFHSTVEEAVKETHANVFFSSGVIQYLETPYEFLKTISGTGFDFVFLDRIGCTLDGSDRITVQRVDPAIYDASYPCWFLSEQKIIAVMSHAYELSFEFSSLDVANLPSAYKGFVFRKRQTAFKGCS